MKVFRWVLILLCFCAVLQPQRASALLDQFMGDSAIYSAVDSSYLRPNILFIVDNSPGMTQAGSRDPYDPLVDYAALIRAQDLTPEYSNTMVYERKSATGGTVNYVPYIDHVDNVTCAEAKKAFIGDPAALPGTTLTAGRSLENQGAGYFAGSLTNKGACTAPQPGNYYLGNLLNYMDYVPADKPEWQASTAYSFGDQVLENGVVYECSVAGTSDSSKPSGFTTDPPAETVTETGGVVWKAPGTIYDIVISTLQQLLPSIRSSVKVGLMVFGENNQGGRIIKPIQNIHTPDYDIEYSELIAEIGNLESHLLSGNHQPVNEAFHDASLYYNGENSSTDKIASDKVDYPAPYDYSCQKNFVITLTTGSSDSDSHTKSIGDLNEDGNYGYVDDAAKFLHENTLEGYEDIQASIIQLMTPYVERLDAAANSAHGRGEYYHVQDQQELLEAILELMENVVGSSDTSFVAPVVPTSPENRSYSGDRVYLGFFYPVSHRPWYGNLKKYGLDGDTQVVDRDGNPATNSEGSFEPSAISFWSDCPEGDLGCADAGLVQAGGTGQELQDRLYDSATDLNQREIYADIDSSLPLSATANHLISENLAPSDFGVTTEAERDKIIQYLHGYDAFDEDGDLNATEKRADWIDSSGAENTGWIQGDILHSKPLIVNYKPFSSAEESSCTQNKTMIFVGGNDGMLHAYRDCDGSEAWAFVPRTVWSNLKELEGLRHTYFVDGSPAVYIFDHDQDGYIESTEGDKVVLIFGFRRGGDAYYALDVTDQENPSILWKIDSGTSGFTDLGETWSEPQVGKVNLSSGKKVVAFFGGGYDVNEDGRFGTVSFPSTPSQQTGEGDVTSEASVAAPYPGAKGRAVYAVEIAALDSTGQPTLSTSANLIWSYTNSDDPDGMVKYSFPSDIATIDSDYDGYVDRLYVGDTGGRMWRFNVGDGDPGSWNANIIAYANVHDDQPGRKILYRPSVALEHGYDLVAFGSGDRAHPLNKAVVDRLYMIKDKGQTGRVSADVVGYDYDGTLGYPYLTDLTSDLLQESSDDDTITSLLNQMNHEDNYGWFIDLENSGEKSLASPRIFNRVAYFTTYAPNETASINPCDAGNLGTSRLYAVDYKTGEAVLNFDEFNDTTPPNERALSDEEKVLRKSDRSVNLGIGIPSGLVVVLPARGDAKVLIGCGGGLCAEDPTSGGRIIPIYWKQK